MISRNNKLMPEEGLLWYETRRKSTYLSSRIFSAVDTPGILYVFSPNHRGALQKLRSIESGSNIDDEELKYC